MVLFGIQRHQQRKKDAVMFHKRAASAKRHSGGVVHRKDSQWNINLMTKNVLEGTDEDGAPHQCPLEKAALCYLLPMLTCAQH